MEGNGSNNFTVSLAADADPNMGNSNSTASMGDPNDKNHITVLAVLPVLLPLVAVIIVFLAARLYVCSHSFWTQLTRVESCGMSLGRKLLRELCKTRPRGWRIWRN